MACYQGTFVAPLLRHIAMQGIKHVAQGSVLVLFLPAALRMGLTILVYQVLLLLCMAAYGQHCLLCASITSVPNQSNITNAAAIKSPAPTHYARPGLLLTCAEKHNLPSKRYSSKLTHQIGSTSTAAGASRTKREGCCQRPVACLCDRIVLATAPLNAA